MRIFPLLAVLILVPPGFGQSASDLTFDVATVKKTDLPQPGKPIFFGRRGGPGTADPGRITWSGVTLKQLLAEAYDVKPYQVSGPDWLDSERYEIVAKVPAGATKEQVKIMWRNLLADRFGVALHHTSKVFQVEEMMPGKSGVKLKETTLDPKTADSQENPPMPPPPPGAIAGIQIPDRGGPGPIAVGPPPGGPPPGGAREGGPFPGPPQLDKNGIPQLKAPGLIMMMTMGPNGPTARMVGKAQTLDKLAELLGNQLNRPVVDKTGLTGKYDFVVEFAPDFAGMKGPPGGGPGALIGGGPGGPGPVGGDTSAAPNASDPGGAPLAVAVQQQLGIRLVSTKSSLDVLVIDKAQKEPTEN